MDSSFFKAAIKKNSDESPVEALLDVLRLSSTVLDAMSVIAGPLVTHLYVLQRIQKSVCFLQRYVNPCPFLRDRL
jgi:hypothetical protein